MIRSMKATPAYRKGWDRIFGPAKKVRKKRKSHKPHWYRMVIDDCPVCGGRTRRKRVYGEKPSEEKDRYERLSPIYCGCLGVV